MNLPTDFLSLGSAISVGFIGLVAWFALDMRSILKSLQQKNRLSIEGRWADLERYYQRASKTWRPFVWLHRRYLLPGTILTTYALFLHDQGRLEEALVKADQAVRQIAKKPKLFRLIYRDGTFKNLRGAFRARILIFTGLGRYDEARKAAAELNQLTGSEDSARGALAILEMHCGHIDEALTLAEGVERQDSQYDAMRGLTSRMYSMKGEHDKALQVLSFESSDAKKFYSPEGLQALSASSTGAKLIELHQRKVAGVFQPARLIRIAMVYIAKDEFENAVSVLDEAEKVLARCPRFKWLTSITEPAAMQP